MLGQITGLRIIESASCYTTKVVVRVKELEAMRGAGSGCDTTS